MTMVAMRFLDERANAQISPMIEPKKRLMTAILRATTNPSMNQSLRSRTYSHLSWYMNPKTRSMCKDVACLVLPDSRNHVEDMERRGANAPRRPHQPRLSYLYSIGKPIGGA